VVEQRHDLGRLVAVHGIAPAYLQRAVFIVVLSFLFFLAMMFAYYLRQNLLYFLLASAFLVLYLVTLFSLVMQRRAVAEIFHSGIRYKKLTATWTEIAQVSDDGTVRLVDGRKIVLPRSLNGFDSLVAHVRSHSAVKVRD
jgi:hypothetical protein